ncbi:D-alanyl-D-alanine carboxypeptidase family protein [Clostridium formicaceticum]|uniref:serine-type D-Ala-D-Ala carboxypeptidase n=1 Tax=Clostridium formicaceticum TaxID=1497 RepID=A0AAC9RLP1_9CLOT|nr:D-alanyl-D-alanine carboxypeptidase family protein [Clostridium formicaceticum]AOY77100.1 D-alanyl-D-alanine carboxypeptidase [Clostridium formicaceticum]ARE87610.1 D-alanyl-D-alanine carboxypeptidase DacB precursor [Clostridium formicaceticum]
MLKRAGIFLLILTTILSVNFYRFAEEVHANGRASIVMDVETGRILYENNIYEQLPMASTTKIMTALLAIENIPEDKMVKIHPKAQGVEGSSIYLEANEKVRMIDLLYGLMLRSGNDAATAIAYEVSGSIEEFAQLMNLRAKEIGAKNTNFVNPHGLHDENHYTTAYDLALITREALKNPIFKEVVKTKFWTAERDGYKHFANKNKTLSICEGGDGVKTGFTKKSGRCLVASATRNNMQFVAVTLNDGDWFNTTNELLNRCFEDYVPYTVFEEGDLTKKVLVEDGKKDALYIHIPTTLIIPIKQEESGKVLSVIKTPEVLQAPVIKGQKIGQIVTYLDGKLVNTTDLFTNEHIDELTTKEKILKKFFGISK